MNTGEVVLEEAKDEESYNFYFAKTKKYDYNAEGAAVTGAAAGKLYNNGMLVEFSSGNDYRKHTVTINGEAAQFIVDKNGNIKTSQKEYKKLNDNDIKVTYLDTREDNFSKEDGAFKGSIVVEEAE